MSQNNIIDRFPTQNNYSPSQTLSFTYNWLVYCRFYPLKTVEKRLISYFNFPDSMCHLPANITWYMLYNCFHICLCFFGITPLVAFSAATHSSSGVHSSYLWNIFVGHSKHSTSKPLIVKMSSLRQRYCSDLCSQKLWPTN